MNKKNNNEERISGLACSTRVDNAQLEPPQYYPGQTPAELPEHEYGLPQVPVPYPIAHAMEFCFENCRIAQRSKEPIGSADSGQQKCRFPLFCSIAWTDDK